MCRLLLVTLLSAVVFHAASHAAEGGRRGLAATTGPVPAVVGGRAARRNRFAYFTALREALTGYNFCGASLIAPRILLTAAHCIVEGATLDAVAWVDHQHVFAKARVGAFETYPVPPLPGPTSFELRQVVAAAVHRRYDPDMNNDIALLLLDRPATKATVKLPTSPDQLVRRAPVGARMLSIGFGMSQFQDKVDDMKAQAYEPTLQQLWMLRQPDVNAEGTFVMAGNPPGFLSDTWKGDSGSPLLVPNTTDPTRDMQFGIVSNGFWGQPGYYTDVSLFSAWITRGQQLLLEPNGLGAEYHIKRLPACNKTANKYCVYCNSEGERLTCVDRTPCYMTYQGQTQLLLRCSDPEFQGGPKAPSGCFKAIQYVDQTGYGQGPGILGDRTFKLQAALGGQLPTDTSPSCPAPAPFVLRACPGAAPSRVCLPGAHPLTGLESGCCACRRVRATAPYVLVYPAVPMVNTYYETAPNCKVAVRALLGGTIVHYTGALVRGNPWLGCRPEKYAKVVLERLTTTGSGVGYEAFYVEADMLVHCSASKACTELGGNCQDAPARCCKLASDGGAPTARCEYPPDVVAPSACATH